MSNVERIPDRALPLPYDTVPEARDDAEACQMILDAMGMVMEYGRIETGTPESMKLRRAYSYFARKAGIKQNEQRANIRRNPIFATRFPIDKES